MLEQYKHQRTRIIDLDGVVFKKQRVFNPNNSIELLPGAVEKVNEWFLEGDYIVFWTARSEQSREQTIRQLNNAGFRYHQLLMNKPWSKETYLYDDKEIVATIIKESIAEIKG